VGEKVDLPANRLFSPHIKRMERLCSRGMGNRSYVVNQIGSIAAANELIRKTDNNSLEWKTLNPNKDCFTAIGPAGENIHVCFDNVYNSYETGSAFLSTFMPFFWARTMTIRRPHPSVRTTVTVTYTNGVKAHFFMGVRTTRRLREAIYGMWRG